MCLISSFHPLLRWNTYLNYYVHLSQPKLIQNEIMMQIKVDYIHNNPVKKGFVDKPAHWRYSSARDYHGVVGLIEVERLW